MGLGAAFKQRKDKDKHKEKSKDVDKSKAMDGKDLDKDDTPKRKSHERDESPDAYAHSPDPFSLSPVPVLGSLNPPTGWTYILEDWFCNGMGSSSFSTKSSPPDQSNAPDPLVNPMNSTARMNGGPPVPQRSLSTDDVNPRVRVTNPQPLADERARERRPGQGPYELLIKERLMGIYLTVFIKRDIKHLVRGKSKSAVTAGLIGGRVGNKGGVGISLNLAGTSLLFINAHLAAHDDKVPLRLANLAKIKAELAVDDYLTTGDPREMKEDITDRFDFTFLFGDLNFRLDVTRLHADWLISRQEYEQAMTFDQLYNIMKNGYAFVGFKEAPVRFPPTFKYDVLRTLKKPSRRHKHPKPALLELDPELHGVDEAEKEHGEDNTRDEDDETGKKDDSGEHDEDVSDDDEQGGGDVASLVSTTWLSFRSKKTANDVHPKEKDDRDDDYFQPLYALAPIPSPASSGTPNQKSKLVHRISLSSAAHKAKSKWLALVTPGSTPRPRSNPTVTQIYNRSNSPTPDLSGGIGSASMASFSALGSVLTVPPDTTTNTTPTSPVFLSTFDMHSHHMSTPALNMPDMQATKSAPVGMGLASTPRDILTMSPSIKRAGSTVSGKDGQQQGDDFDRGVYDTSSKKRVPSW
jgi:hypothetical protein